MSNITRSRLTTIQAVRLAEYINGAKSGFDGKTAADLAAEAATALGFDVSEKSFSNLASKMGVKWSRAKKKLAPKNSAQPKNNLLYRRIRTLARIQKRLIEEFGIELKQSQLEVLDEMCAYSQDDAA